MLTTRTKLRIARALSRAIVGTRSLVGRSAIVDARRFGVNWRLDLNEGIDLAIYVGRYQNFTARTLAYLKPDSLALDIGANIGAHCLRMARLLGPDGRVVAIEPTHYAFAKLALNAGLNSELRSRVELVQAALTDGSGASDASEFYARWPLHATDFARRTGPYLGELESAQNVRSLPLDALLAEMRASGRIRGKVSFVKLDVDGHELEVLRGGRETFLQERPFMLVEISPHEQDAVAQRFELMMQVLSELGYRLEHSRTGEPLPMSAEVLRKLIGTGYSIDAFARPS